MEKEITKNIEYMSKSNQELARIMKSQKHVVEHMSRLVNDIPNDDTDFSNLLESIENSLLVSKSVSAYLYSLSNLEEAITANLGYVLKELRGPTEDE